MIAATKQDRQRVIDILSGAFNENKSVHYILKKSRKEQSIKRLMEYAFQVCLLYGKVFLSDDGAACALILLPDKKKSDLQSVSLDVKLVINCIGLSNLRKALRRENKISKLQEMDKDQIYYLWFIGVDIGQQNKGISTALLKEVMTDCRHMKRNIFLETSTTRNLPWYKKYGFTQYADYDFGYTLYFLRN